MGKMEDGSVVVGEHNITQSVKKVKSVYYKKAPKIRKEVIEAIREADLIILSMGSLFTSILPNLICKDIVSEIDKSEARILYACNMMTQPGETDNFTVGDHIELLNKYLGKRKIDTVIANNGKIKEELILKYETIEQKDQVLLDKNNLKKLKVEVIEDDLVFIENEMIRHNSMKLSFYIFSLLLRN